MILRFIISLKQLIILFYKNQLILNNILNLNGPLQDENKLYYHDNYEIKPFTVRKLHLLEYLNLIHIMLSCYKVDLVQCSILFIHLLLNFAKLFLETLIKKNNFYLHMNSNLLLFDIFKKQLSNLFFRKIHFLLFFSNNKS